MEKSTKIHLALYQPDIPQNVGAAIRLCACLGIPLDIIEPCGFPWNTNKISRVSMDYINHITLNRHESWEKFLETYKDRRIILMTTKSSESYTQFEFQDGDILLAGRESSGVPEEVHQYLDQHRIKIPMYGEMRSLNIINASAMIVGEALRQTGDLS